MPGLDGLETLEQIQPIPDAPPVVFVTASQDSAIAVTALKAGAADYLVKDTRAISSRCCRSPSTARSGRRASARRATRPRPRFTPRATATRRSPPSARCCCARSTTASAIRCRSSPRCCICRRNSSQQADVKAALTNAMGRVAAVAQVHRRLYTSHDLKSVLLNQYLEALLEDLRRSAEGNRMSRLTLQCRAGRDRSGPRGGDRHHRQRTGDERGEIRLSRRRRPDPRRTCSAEGDDIELSIADDGVGLNVKADPRSTGMGQRIVSAMADQARSHRRARSRPMRGTRIVLRFRRINQPANELAPVH